MKQITQQVREEIIEYYLGTGCPLKQLSSKFGYSERTMSNLLTKYFKDKKLNNIHS